MKLCGILLAKSDSLKHFIAIKSILFSLLYFKLFKDNKNILNKYIFHSLSKSIWLIYMHKLNYNVLEL